MKANLDTYKEDSLLSRLDSAGSHLLSGEWPCTWVDGGNGVGEGVICTKAQDGPVKGPIVKQVG